MLRESQRLGRRPFGAGGIAPTFVLAGLLLMAAGSARADADFLLNEIHLQYGSLDVTRFEGGGSIDTFIITSLHASKWGPVDFFYFADLQKTADGDTDFYGEFYGGVSLFDLAGRKNLIGPIRDLSLRVGFNYGADPKLRKYLTGVHFVFEVPGFHVVGLDAMAILDDSSGLASGGIPKQSDGWNLDLSFSSKSLEFGRYSFSFNGHVEYMSGRHDELGQPVTWWILAQPQFRLDLGKALGHTPNKLFVGVEWQFWINKLGDASTDENIIEALIAWRF